MSCIGQPRSGYVSASPKILYTVRSSDLIPMAKSYLVLEDGNVFEGEPFGYNDSAVGEVVFSTRTSGYQEDLTDTSYRGQILVATYPLIGNYGVNDEIFRSRTIQARALVVREYCKEPSPMYGGHTIDEFLNKNKIPGISGIDTRELVIKIRTNGTLKGALTDNKDDAENIIKKLKDAPMPSENNLVEEVSCKRTETYGSGKKVRIGIIDCGEKNRVIGSLSQRADITVFPYDTPSDVIREHNVKGLIISGGPGDPAHPVMLGTTVRTISDLSAEMPLFGIGLGGQMIAKAMGGSTYKMKTGHRGNNQPVKYDGKIFITSQNHGFAVDDNSIEGKDLIADQININDGTVEGFRHRDLPIFASQYHPEASQGPRDNSFLLERFIKIAEAERP